MFKRVLEKAEEPETKVPSNCWIIEKAREFQKNIYFCFTDYAKAFDCADHNKLWKTLKEMGISDHLTCLLRNLYAGQEVTELDVEQRTGSKLLKEYIKAIYCHPAYLTYMQSIPYEMPGWIKHKLESRSQGGVSITSHMQMTTLYGRKQRGTKEPLYESKSRE